MRAAGWNMNSQPDFTRIFKEHFSSATAGVRYELRGPPDTLHDAMFLSSLIHDARFRRSEIARSGATLTIPMERDRWELFEAGAKNPSLATCRSTLVLEAVHDVRWTAGLNGDSALQMDYLWVDEGCREHDAATFDIILAGVGWRMAIAVDALDFTCALTDDEYR